MSGIDFLKQQHQEVDTLFERLKEADDEERITLLGQIAEKLTIHSALEEKELYPLAREAGLDELTDHSLEEHAQVKRVLAQILSAKRRDPNLQNLVQKLEARVKEHVGEEEEKLFPQLEERVGEARLNQLEARMREDLGRLEGQELLEEAEAQHTPQA